MTNKQWTESEYRTKTFLTIAPLLFLMLIAIAGISKNCAGSSIDPIDDDIMSSRKVVKHLNVLDTTHNGFRVVYATKNNVTEARLEEIQSRPSPHVRDAFKSLQTDAPPHFGGSLLYTDIYDFADFAVMRDPDPDIEMHSISILERSRESSICRTTIFITGGAKTLESTVTGNAAASTKLPKPTNVSVTFPKTKEYGEIIFFLCIYQQDMIENWVVM